MTRRAAAIAFLESREGFGWIVIATFAAVLAVVAGCGFYEVSLGTYVDNKTDEKGTALELVDAFVSNYSNLRREFGNDSAPVPATFRAHSIELFNRTRSASNAMKLRWIGREGRAIATPPADPKMAATIESFVGRSDPAPVSQFLTISGEQVFRTVYPSVAREHSCVDCHNRLQPDLNWQLNDVMGAFSIDAPVGEFLHNLRLESTAIALVIFFLIGGVGLWISLSHYRRIVEREAARRQAEQANQAKSAFLATVSHELRTPLNTITGFSEMMLGEVLGAFPNAKYRAYVADIHNSGSHLLDVIDDILDLSKAEAGKLDLNESVFDLRDTIHSISPLISDRIRAAGLTHKIELPAELPLLRADEIKTRQALLNLVANAVKLVPPGGRVELSCRADRQSGLAITVTDRETRIAPRPGKRALDAVQPIDPSGARQQHGSELGLALVKAIMKLHGGTLEPNDPAGPGFRVTITFPAERLAFEPLRSAA
jgi:signal transduction histidine kinase